VDLNPEGELICCSEMSLAVQISGIWSAEGHLQLPNIG